LASCFKDIFGAQDGRDDGDAIRAGPHDLPGIIPSDAADGQDRNREPGADVPEAPQAQRSKGSVFSRSGENRPQADIIRAILFSFSGFLEAGDTKPDEPIFSQYSAGGGQGQVLLAQMDPGRAASQGDIGTVVNDQRNLFLTEERSRLQAEIQESRSREVFGPELDQGHAPGCRLPDNLDEVPPPGALRIRHQTKGPGDFMRKMLATFFPHFS
jgi:hypothetical protein